MLSTENPPSSDPPCTPPRDISQRKSGGGDERASDKVPLQEVDLLKSGLDYDKNPLPKFSIRDYVFSARSKDIKTNWPFRQKNLQLCLKHGVKDLLPPFQTVESVRNRSIERCKAEASPVEEETKGNLDGESSRPTDLVSVTSDNPGCSQNLGVDCQNLGLERSEREKKDNQVPVNTNSPSHSEIDSVPGDKSQNKNQTPFKKCRLIVKVGGGAVDPRSNEDHMTNCVAVSETMASKVCPVCKTFSSSSNTTLNAHIDQCLSLESSMKWTPNSRVIKHRIKPGKMRFMTDIYATAPHCTLEELDRRNGTNWSMNTSFPTEENEDCAEEGIERVAAVDFKKKGDEGAVYIDANGTKVRILSKFNDVSLHKTEADLRNHIFLKGGKGNKLVSNYKKKHHAQKHQNYLKLAMQSKKLYSPKPPCTTEVRGDGEKTFALVENRRKVGSLEQPFKAQEQMKRHDSGTMMKWACSKRTVLFKKRSPKEGLQSLGRKVRQEFPVESDRQSSLGYPYMERSCIEKNPNLHEGPLSSPESRKRIRDSSFKMPFSECHEELHVKQLRNASCKGFANNGEHYVPFLGKKPVEINANLCSNPLRSQHAFSSKAPKFSSLKKHVLLSGHSVVPKSKGKIKKFPSDDKSVMRCSTEYRKDVMVFPSKIVGQHDSKPKHPENLSQIPGKASPGKSSVLKLRKKRGGFGISQYEESRSLKSKAECHVHEVSNNLDFSARVGRDFTDTIADTVISPSLGVDLGGNAISLSRSLAPEFHKLGTPSLLDEPEIFCVDTAGDSKIAENTDLGEGGMDSKYGQGNYFSQVDPIPLPGPPGSYLPSPKDMGSEDLQGNSSITTSRVYSSEDYRDLVDRDSSDSPISATSTICNSMIKRSDSKSSKKLFTQDDENCLGLYVAGSCDAVAENSIVPVTQAATIQTERVNLHELKNNMMAPGKGFTSFRNDQPCCCSRKEGMSHGVSLNYQESQLLRRRTTASAFTGKQQIGDLDRRLNGFNSMPETISIDIFPVTKSAEGPVSAKISVDSALSSPAFGDCDSAIPSPSASNSVLRLMGKNLMVVNKDEKVSQQLKPVTQPISPNDHPNQHFQNLSGFFPGNSQSEDFPSFYRMVHQLPNMGFRSYATSKTPQAPSPLASSGVFLGKNVGGYNFPNDQYRSWNRNADNTTNPMKEIIVIDEETPARKADSAADSATFSEIIMENRVSSAGIPIPMAANYDSRYMNPFYSYQPQDYPPNSESKSLMAQNASFQIPPHIRASASSINLRSPLYYSPSFS